MKNVSVNGIIISCLLILTAVESVRAENLNADFDGNSKKSKSVPIGLIDTATNNTTPPAVPEGEKTTIPIGGGIRGVSVMKVVEVLKSGKEIVRFDSSSGKAVSAPSEFSPNSLFYYEFNCTGQNPNPWNVCEYYQFNPDVAGHNHQPTSPLLFTGQDGSPLPSPICGSNIAVNTPFRIYIKAPIFSARVNESSQFSGACQGTISDVTDIKVTANGVIQLQELSAEPYFRFKQADGNHPANRFGTPDTNAKLKQIAFEYYDMYHPTPSGMLTVNDMGLIWGGRYNTNAPYNCWADGGEHVRHRYGRQVDVRSFNIPEGNRKCFEEIACKYLVAPILEGSAPGSLSNIDISKLKPSELDALDKVEHYHLNFARPTDPPVDPADDARSNCPGTPPAFTSCPKPLR